MNNLTVLPEAIGSLASLQTLELSDNRLSSLPAGMGKLGGLLTLGLRSNALAALPVEIGGLGALTYLDVSMNHLTVRFAVTQLDKNYIICWCLAQGSGGVLHCA